MNTRRRTESCCCATENPMAYRPMTSSSGSPTVCHCLAEGGLYCVTISSTESEIPSTAPLSVILEPRARPSPPSISMVMCEPPSPTTTWSCVPRVFGGRPGMQRRRQVPLGSEPATRSGLEALETPRSGSSRLTFDMSGSRRQARPAGRCPLDGRVRDGLK